MCAGSSSDNSSRPLTGLEDLVQPYKHDARKLADVRRHEPEELPARPLERRHLVIAQLRPVTGEALDELLSWR